MRYFVIIMAGMFMTACQTTAAPVGTETEHHKAHGEPTPYDSAADAQMDVAATLAASEASGKMALIVMGANWCHDSRALAAQFQKGRVEDVINSHYELVYVDVGKKNRNIDIAQDFGLSSIVGTPTVFIVSPEGDVLNLDTAPTWRNAATRSKYEILEYFRSFAHGKRN